MSEEKYYFEKEIYCNNYIFKFKPDNDILQFVLKIKKKGKVLDLGCGEAGTSLKLAEKGFEVTCVDISRTAIRAVKEEAQKKEPQDKSFVQRY